MTKRFRVLWLIADIYQIVGYAAMMLAVLMGVLTVVTNLVEVQIGVVVGGLITGGLLVGFGQLIYAILSIEENTRATAEHTRQTAELLGKRFGR
jgi:hypothetical protein